MLALTLALGVLAARAGAGTPVIFAQGEADEIVARLQEGGGVSDDLVLEPMPLERIRALDPHVEGGTVRRCTQAPVDLAVVLSLAKDAEGDLLYLDYERALEALDHAAARLVCLTGAADRHVLTRIFFLTGYARLALGDVSAAKASFRRLFETEPDYAWDPSLPPDGTAVFEATRHEHQATLPVIYDVVPMPPRGMLLVDGGRPSPSSTLAPGVHLFQMIDAGRTYTLEVTFSGDGPATVVWPRLLPPDPLDWMNDARGQDAFGAAIDATLQANDIIVTTPNDTWRRVAPGTPFVPVVREDGPRRTRWLLLGGSVLATGGATLVLVSASQANAAASLAERTHELETYTDAEESYEAAERQRRAAVALTIGGVAVAGIGVVMPVSGGFAIRPSLGGLAIGGAW